jgi:hypothetical protein
LPSAEEIAAYTLPEPSDLMPPPLAPVTRRPAPVSPPAEGMFIYDIRYKSNNKSKTLLYGQRGKFDIFNNDHMRNKYILLINLLTWSVIEIKKILCLP